MFKSQLYLFKSKLYLLKTQLYLLHLTYIYLELSFIRLKKYLIRGSIYIKNNVLKTKPYLHRKNYKENNLFCLLLKFFINFINQNIHWKSYCIIFKKILCMHDKFIILISILYLETYSMIQSTFYRFLWHFKIFKYNSLQFLKFHNPRWMHCCFIISIIKIKIIIILISVSAQ